MTPISFYLMTAAVVIETVIAVFSIVQWTKWENAARSHMNRVRDLESKQKTQWVPLFHYPKEKQ